MRDDLGFVLMNLPNPPRRNINRDYAGGFGTIGPLSSKTLLPVYLLYGASAMKKARCKYKILEAQGMNYSFAQTVNMVIEDKPDVLISWLSLPSIYDDLALLDEIKKVMPNVLIIVLGVVGNVMSEEILLKSNVDLVIKGWYPHYNLIFNLVDVLKNNSLSKDTFKQIGGAVYVEDGRITQSSIEPFDEDLDQLSLDVYYQLPLDRYLIRLQDARGSTLRCIPIITSMGCPYACMYCPYPLGFGRKIRHKSIINIVEEMEFLRNNFGVSSFIFRDQLFTHNKQRVLDLCDEIINRDLNIKWIVEARVDEVSEELLLKMKSAGCFRINYGVETGSQEMFKKIGKPGVETDSIKKAFGITRELDIATTAHMLLGLPGETKETLQSSLEMLCTINPNDANSNIATPYPGTRLFEMASKKGWISTYDWSKYSSYDAIISTGYLSVDQISIATKRVIRRFRNYKLWHDSNYRKLYFKISLRIIYERLKSLFGFR